MDILDETLKNYFIVTAQLVYNGQRYGYNIATVNKRDVSIAQVQKEDLSSLEQFFEAGLVLNASLLPDGSDIIMNVGTFEMLPAYDRFGVSRSQTVLYPIRLLYSEDGTTLIGASLVNPVGEVSYVSLTRLVELDESFLLQGVDISQDSVTYKGSTQNLFRVKVRDTALNKTIKSTDDVLSAPLSSCNESDIILDPSIIDDVRKYEATPDTIYKLNDVRENIRKMSPWFDATLESISISLVQSDVITTMAASESEIIINVNFLNKLSIPQASFVLIHEAYHVILGHAVMFKMNGYKNHMLFNIAADLYINETICHDFGCKFRGGVAELNGGKICTPDDGVFYALWDETAQFNVGFETVEDIYAKLELANEQKKQNNQNDQFKPSTDSGSGSGGSGNNQPSPLEKAVSALNALKAVLDTLDEAIKGVSSAKKHTDAIMDGLSKLDEIKTKANTVGLAKDFEQVLDAI